MLSAKNWVLQIKNIWVQPHQGCFLLTHIYICLILGVFPLVVGVEGYGNITASKYWFFVTITGCWLLLLAALLLRQRAMGGRAALSFGLPQKLILVYLLLCLLSAIFSPYPHIAWTGGGRYEGLLTMTLYMGAFWGVTLFGRFRKMYLYLLAAAVGINIVLSLFQLAGLDPLWLYPGDYDYYDGNLSYSGQFLGTIGNIGLLSAFFCLTIPAFICWFIKKGREDRFSWLLLLAAIGAVYILLRAQVAAGLLALAVCCAVLLFLLLQTKKARLIWLFLLIVLLLLMLLFLWNYNGAEEGFFYELSSLLHGETRESFGSGRLAIWTAAMELLPERPLLGGGPDTIGKRLDMIFTTQAEDSPIVRQTRVDNAHNDYLNIAVNTGLPSLAVYLAALVASAVFWIKKRKDAASLCIGAGLLAYFVQIFFSFSLCLVAPIAWLMWGIMYSPPSPAVAAR